jgi:hypothetical protein
MPPIKSGGCSYLNEYGRRPRRPPKPTISKHAWKDGNTVKFAQFAEVFLQTADGRSSGVGTSSASTTTQEIATMTTPTQPTTDGDPNLTGNLPGSGWRPEVRDTGRISGCGAMAYIKPSWFFARIFNRIALATGAVNSQPLTVIKRGSKSPQTIPMTPVDVEGVKYLVSVRGETEWVKNVRANPHVKLTKSGATDYAATEIPVGARKPIIEAYKATASKATARFFRELPAAADHPVFALTPLRY